MADVVLNDSYGTVPSLGDVINGAASPDPVLSSGNDYYLRNTDGSWLVIVIENLVLDSNGEPVSGTVLGLRYESSDTNTVYATATNVNVPVVTAYNALTFDGLISDMTEEWGAVIDIMREPDVVVEFVDPGNNTSFNAEGWQNTDGTWTFVDGNDWFLNGTVGGTVAFMHLFSSLPTQSQWPFDPNGPFVNRLDALDLGNMPFTEFTDLRYQSPGDNFLDSLLTGNDTVTAGTGDDTLAGGDGDDVLNGGAGDDLLIAGDGSGSGGAAAAVPFSTGGNGNDTYIGGADNDTIDYSGTTQGVTVNLSAASNHATGVEIDTDQISGVENVVGGQGNDIMTGNSLANRLEGLDGDDTLDGRVGIDTMVGGLGNDVYFADTYLDVIIELDGEGTFDQAYASANYALTPGAAVERLGTTDIQGTDNIILIGNEFGQQMLGNEGNNILAGGGGVDSFVGYGGNDIYVTDRPGEIVVEAAGQGYDSIYTSSSYTIAAGVSIERFVTTSQAGTTQINLVGNEIGQVMGGNAANNSIYGGGGNDSLYGYNGNDFLEGGEGNDSLFGGAGVDRFIFREALGTSSGIDRIYDMNSADNILIDGLAYSGSIRSLTAAEFRIGSAALDADDRVIYDDTSGVFWFDADGNGAGAAILFGVINGAPAGVDHTWFELF